MGIRLLVVAFTAMLFVLVAQCRQDAHAGILAVSAASAQEIVMKEAGIVRIPSHHSVDETVDRLKNILRSKGITLFALIDHSGDVADLVCPFTSASVRKRQTSCAAAE